MTKDEAVTGALKALLSWSQNIDERLSKIEKQNEPVRWSVPTEFVYCLRCGAKREQPSEVAVFPVFCGDCRPICGFEPALRQVKRA